MKKITISEVTVVEFDKYFNQLPINYRSAEGIEFITFITTVDVFDQLFLNGGFYVPFDRALSSIDRSGNRISFKIRNFNDPDGEFKKIITIFNTVTGEKIALIAA